MCSPGHNRPRPWAYPAALDRGRARARSGLRAPAGLGNDSGIPRSTLTDLYDNQRALYVDGETDDDRKDAALDAIRPLPEFENGDRDSNDLDERIRAVVREELKSKQ